MLPLVFAFAVAVIAMFAIPATASATFGISGYSYTNSTLQAAGHPNTTISFNRTGTESDDLRDVLIDLPTGVFPNQENGNPKCTVTQFNSDTCPSTSQVGTLSLNITAASLLNLTAPGTIYMITPDPTNVATLGMIVRPAKICILWIFCAVPDKQFLKTGITVRTYQDSGLRTYTPGSPHTTSIAIPPIVKSGLITLNITVKKLTLNFQSRYNSTNSGNYFWGDTGSCTTATSNVTITSYNNESVSSSASYVPTGCASVPQNYSIGFTPASTQAGAAPSSVKFDLNVPDPELAIEDGLPKIVDVDFPNGSGLDLNALSGVTACTETQLRAMACPASSIIGTANATSKDLPNVTNPALPGLVGNVYAMGIGNQIPVGVQIIGPRNTVVIFRGTLGTRGDANAGTGRVYATFDRIPQLPFRNFSLTFTKPVYKNPDNCAAQTVSATITGFNGTDATSGNGSVSTRTSGYTTTNCAPAPDTTITAGPPSTTTNRQAPISFTSTIAGSTFQCKMDQTAPVTVTGTYGLCSSPNTPSVPQQDGNYTFSVYAVNGLTPDPTPATYSYTVSTGTYNISLPSGVTVTSSQAVGHPDLATTVNISGGQPRSVSIKLPAGFDASLSALPLCSATDAAAGNCAAASKIGTLQITANTFSGAVSGVGNVYLTAAPTASDAGGIAVNVPLAGLGNFIAQGGAGTINNGNNENLSIRNFPTNVGGTDITITQLVMNLSGANKFLTNASNCASTDGFVISSTAFDGSTASPINAAYQATGCSTVPFNPSINISLSNPTAAAETGLTANLGLAPDNSSIKILRVNMPPSVGPNYPSFGVAADQCPAGSAPSSTSIFDPSACPAQAKVGTMTINTPLLPFPLTGTVHLINKSPLPWLGVQFNNPGITVRLTGVTSTPQVDPTCDPLTDPNGFCQTQISAVFNNVPDVPITSIGMTLDGPARTGLNNATLSGKILVVATANDPSCKTTAPATSTFYPYTATATVVRTQVIPIGGCL